MIPELKPESRKQRTTFADMFFCFIYEAQVREGPWVQFFAASVGVCFLITPSIFSVFMIAIENLHWQGELIVKTLSIKHVYLVASAVSFALATTIYRVRKSKTDLIFKHSVKLRVQTAHGRLLGAAVLFVSVIGLVFLSVRNPYVCLLASLPLCLAPSDFRQYRDTKGSGNT